MSGSGTLASPIGRIATLADALTAMHRRLHAAAGPLGLTTTSPDPAADQEARHVDPTAAVADLLEQATRAVQRLGGHDRLWLLLAVAQGQYPLQDDIRRLRRNLELDDVAAGSRFLLTCTEEQVSAFPMAATRIVGDRVLVDAGHTAGSDLATGIQRVVREVLRRWIADQPVLPVAWTATQSCTRTLTATETQRVSHWGRAPGPAEPAPAAALVLPWRTTYVLPEVPPEPERLQRLTALARYSGSRVVLIGYDLIPVTNAGAVEPALASRFAHYVSTVKHATKVVAISETAAAEFRGFTRAFAPQGLPAPEVVACPLPTELPPVGGTTDPPAPVGSAPLVLCVGSVEERKNHLAVLAAAELLWREGLVFRLLMVGKTSPYSEPVLHRIAELQDQGRDLELRSDVSDSGLRAAYAAARLSVFVSTHEGYGLPVAESLATGTPVVTTRYGSTAEAAAGGGALLVDPHDDDDIAGALRSLLTDDRLHAELVRQCRARPGRSWDQYASELWAQVEAVAVDQP